MIYEKGLPGGSNHTWDVVPFPSADRSVSDRIARKTRYRDGTRVFSCACGSGKYVMDCCRRKDFSQIELAQAEDWQFQQDCKVTA
jgi:hypothetical protein